MNIFVAKLGGSTTGDDLLELFKQYGEVNSAKVIFDKETGSSKRFGFVEMADDGEAQKAIAELNDSDFMDSKIVVKKAIPKTEAPQQRRNNFGGGGYKRRPQ